MNKLHVIIAFLLGIVVWQAIVSLHPAPVLADTSEGNDLVAVAVRFEQDREMLAVIDAERHLAIYELASGNRLRLLQSRTIDGDLRLDFYSLGRGTQEPTAKQISDFWKTQEEEGR